MRQVFAIVCVIAVLGCTKRSTSGEDEADQEMSAPERVVMAQVDAYNRHDLEGFVQTYARDVQTYAFPDVLVGRGDSTLRNLTARLFTTTPTIHATVSRRLVSGNYVILGEVVTGTPAADTTIVIYEVKDAKITRVWFLP